MEEYEAQYRLMINDHVKKTHSKPKDQILADIRISESEKEKFEEIVDLINRTFEQFEDYEVSVSLFKCRRKKVNKDVS